MNLLLESLLPDLSICDPFNRLSALEHDAIMLVEFSEVEGPKPTFLTPSCPGAHFSASDFALWLMTADYQQHNKGAFGVAEDIGMVVHNEEQGVYAYARYFSLFDIDARGFVRPFCLAYLTPDPTKLDYCEFNIHLALKVARFPEVHEKVGNLLEGVKKCNRRQFLRELTEAVETLHSVENQAICSYYELYYEQSAMDSNRVEQLNMRTRKLLRELQLAHKVVSRCLPPNSPTCTHHPPVDMDPWIARVVHFNAKMEGAEKTLKVVNRLMPCVQETFFSSLCRLWSTLRRTHPYSNFMLEQRVPGATVTLDGLPILTLPAAVKSTPGEQEDTEKWDEAFFELLNVTHSERSRSVQGSVREGGPSEPHLLKSILPVLSHVLLPVLSGHFVLACATDQRRSTLTAMLSKLRLFVPRSAVSPVKPVCHRWHEGRVPPSAFVDYKLFGVRLKSEQDVADVVASNVQPFLSILDLNNDILTSSRYEGHILSRLSKKKKTSFCEDSTLVSYLMTLVGEYALLAYVLFYLMYVNQTAYRKNVGILPQWVKDMGLGKGDLKIVKLFVELVKVQHCAEGNTQMRGSFENLFLDNEVAEIFKL